MFIVINFRVVRGTLDAVISYSNITYHYMVFKYRSCNRLYSYIG